MDNDKRTALISERYLFFVVAAAQIGVGAQSFQQSLYKAAGHDAWVSILISGLLTMASGAAIVLILRMGGSRDWFGLHEWIFGRRAGFCAGALFVAYLWLECSSVIYSDMEIIRSWLFPDLPAWVFLGVSALIIYYGVCGGIRVIVGYCAVLFLTSMWLFALYGFYFDTMEWRRLLPLWETPLPDLMEGARRCAYSMMGFEVLYAIHPFVEQGGRRMRYVLGAILFTTLNYLVMMVTALAFYSGGQLEITKWPTLTAYKIIKLPFLERFELIAVAFWLLLVLDTCLLTMWAASRGVRILTGLRMNTALIAGLAVMVGISPWITPQISEIMGKWLSDAGIILVYGYTPLLLLLVWWKKKRSAAR